MKTSSYDEFLAGLISRSAQNDGPARGAAIERYRGGPNEGPKAASPQHILTMGSGFPARFERAAGHRNSVSYVKAPGSLSLVPAGVRPVISARSDFELIVCALDALLVNEVQAELDKRLESELRFRADFEDPGDAAFDEASLCRSRTWLSSVQTLYGSPHPCAYLSISRYWKSRRSAEHSEAGIAPSQAHSASSGRADA